MPAHNMLLLAALCLAALCTALASRLRLLGRRHRRLRRALVRLAQERDMLRWELAMGPRMSGAILEATVSSHAAALSRPDLPLACPLVTRENRVVPRSPRQHREREIRLG